MSIRCERGHIALSFLNSGMITLTELLQVLDVLSLSLMTKTTLLFSKDMQSIRKACKVWLLGAETSATKFTIFKLKSLRDKDSKGIKVFKYEVTMATSHACEFHGTGDLEIKKPFINLVTR